MPKLSKRWKIAAIIFGCCVILAGVFLYFAARSFSGEEKMESHVATVDWLPKEASDITYWKRDGLFHLLVVECTLPRRALDDFAKKYEWVLEEKKDYNVTGLRTALRLPPVRNSDSMDVYPTALVYERRQGNGGGITVVYDIELQRLFVHESAN